MDELDFWEKLEKRVKVMHLSLHAELGPLAKYIDHDSTELLDEKIRVLGEVIDGKHFDEIEGFYDIFELLPKEGFWD